MNTPYQAKAFFHLENEQWYIGNDPARGPWDENACHAGPVTGVIARELEQLVPDKQLFRLTVEVLKPVPMRGFQIHSEFRKQGRMVSTATATVVDRSGKIIAVASSLHAKTLKVGELPTATISKPDFDESIPGDLPIKDAKHNLPFFSAGIEIRYPPEENSHPGPTTIWMKTLPLLESELPSPFQRLCPLADCGNGISRNQEVSEANFLNPDLTIIMFRAPTSNWLASKAKSFWESSGLGMSDATLFDTDGPIGSALQTLLVHPV